MTKWKCQTYTYIYTPHVKTAAFIVTKEQHKHIKQQVFHTHDLYTKNKNTQLHVVPLKQVLKTLQSKQLKICKW